MPTESLLGNQLLSAIKWQQFPKKYQHSKVRMLMNLGAGCLQVKKRISEVEEILEHSSPNFIDEKTEAQRGNVTHSICTQYI